MTIAIIQRLLRRVDAPFLGSASMGSAGTPSDLGAGGPLPPARITRAIEDAKANQFIQTARGPQL